MLITRTYKVRLYPNKQQAEQMGKILDGSRFVYNHYLEQRKGHYLENKKTLPYLKMAKDLTVLRKTNDLLKGVQSEPLQQSLRRLDVAYSRFFRKVSKFPRFKSRFDTKQSFQKHQDWRVRENKIQIQADLIVKYRGFIDPKAELGTLVVLRQSGKWFGTIFAETETKNPKRYSKPIGVDVGLQTLVATSTGKKYPNIQAQKTLQERLTKAQRKLARRRKGSKRREIAKLEVARLYEKIKNVRQNHIHQVSADIVSKNPSLIAIEDLNISGMMKNRRLSRALGDASLREVLRQITYKQGWNGGKVVKIDRYFPSSKTCSKCGFIIDKLPLNIRKWTCNKCNTEHDRDINAAKVILKQAL